MSDKIVFIKLHPLTNLSMTSFFCIILLGLYLFRRGERDSGVLSPLPDTPRPQSGVRGLLLVHNHRLNPRSTGTLLRRTPDVFDLWYGSISGNVPFTTVLTVVESSSFPVGSGYQRCPRVQPPQVVLLQPSLLCRTVSVGSTSFRPK